ncbi:MAG: protein translocase subunit SecD [Planctomycetaceae bacterium]
MFDFSMGLSVLADAADKPVVVQPVDDTVDLGFRLLVLLALFVVPYIIGTLLARALRMKEYSNRIGTVLLAFALGLAPFGYHIIKAGNFDGWKNALRWGIDLAGGTNLIYQVDTKPVSGKNITVAEAMDQMIATIKKRINPSGTEEVTVRKVGESRIEIIIPGADQGVVAEKKAAMVRLGSLEFGIVANEKDHRSWIAAARLLPTTQDNLIEGNQVVAVWRELDKKADSMPASSVRTVLRKDKKGKDAPIQQVLIVQDAEEDLVTGTNLRRASPSISDDGSPCVNFSFDSEGAMKFFRLTSKNRPAPDGTKRQLAVILDGKVHSAPNINSAIRENGQITGVPADEIQPLVGVLNAGALNLPIDPTPISEFTISPLLGADVQSKGLLAIYISSLAVFVFMLAYYRFAGLVADISLVLNMILIVGSMAICNATITLPGLAGMVLTIGMAVDSNVLIYERMREEMERGSSLRMMIHNGFDKALSAIVDSNVTTLIAAVVLYFIGTDQIKGFAVSLFIGLTMSMFSVLTFGRLMFDIAERKRLIRDKLTMLKLIGITKFDFISKLKIALTGSIAFIVIGVAMVIARGTESLDIDFSGGSMLTFRFVHDQQIDDVRAKLQASGQQNKELNAISLERLAEAGESQSAERGKQFRLRTKETDITAIRKAIAATFLNVPNYELQRVTVDFKPITKSASATTNNSDPVSGARGDDEVPTAAPKTDPKAESKPEPKTDPKAESKPEPKTDPKAESKPDESLKDENAGAEIPPTKTAPPKDESAKPKSETKSPSAKSPSAKSPAEKTSGAKTPGNVSIENDDPFANPYITELTFTSEIATSKANEISTSTAEEYLLAELKKINPAYTDARVLFRTTGTSGSGLKSADNKAKTFDKMRLEVRNTVDEAELSQALRAMQETLKSTPIFEEVSNFASSVAEDMRFWAIVALLASGVGTVIYLWFRFTKADFGIAAVVAVFHDVLFTLACLPMAYYLSKTPLGPILGLEDFKLNLSIIAAFMTIIGYSLNDTIVIFDRIREIRGRNPMLTPQMVNDSVNQTLSRTILTAVTVFITVAILYFIGGDGIHGFAFCMLVGTLVGCYSTIYIASPILLWMWNREQKQRAAGRL